MTLYDPYMTPMRPLYNMTPYATPILYDPPYATPNTTPLCDPYVTYDPYVIPM